MNRKSTKRLVARLRLLIVCVYSVGVGFAAFMLRRKKGDCITLYGYYGASDKSPMRNLGDNAILLSMLHSISTIDSHKLIYVFDKEGRYSSFGEEYHIGNKGKGSLRKWLPIISRTRVFVMGGGGLQQAYHGIGTTLFFLRLNLFFWLAGRKIMWYSVGVGPLSTRLSRLFTLIAAKLAHIITVRDEQSKKLLVKIGIPGRKIHITADPAFALKTLERHPRRTKNHKSIEIGLSIIPFYEASGANVQRDTKTIKEYRLFIQELVSRGVSVSLLAFENTQDKAIFYDILKGIDSSHNVKVLGLGISVNEMLKHYARLDYVIGMRFHSLVLGCITGIPTGAVIYHPKVRALVKEFGLQKYSCELEEVTSDKLRQILDRLEADQGAILKKMPELVRRKRALLDFNKELLSGLMKEKF
ncbi:MAG: polysaccharide pyruvyl transferase family protein [Planctomycetota bacterium]|jgi:polysaccharide pyruvyl transferase WcaK-like protein